MFVYYTGRMSKKDSPEKIELTPEQIEDLKSKINSNTLSDAEKKILVDALSAMSWLSRMLEAKRLSLKKLNKLFFGKKTEELPPEPEKDKTASDKDKKPPKGKSGNGNGGKKGKNDYTGANRVAVEHEDLSKGDTCPACGKGKLYHLEAGSFISISGSSPLSATEYQLERFRCSGCGAVFTAKLPAGVDSSKYTSSADAMLALLRYGMGTPHFRLGRLQNYLGVPIPTSTQWERIEEVAKPCYPIFRKLMKLASNAELGFIDDTGGKIVDFVPPEGQRKGIYTTGIVTKTGKLKINLFFTGNRHAGENLKELLKERSAEAKFIQMNDALASNSLGDQTIECNCLAHARRNFYDLLEEDSLKCRYVLKLIQKVYDVERLTTDMNPADRLKFHQKHSLRIMNKLRRWCYKMFFRKKVEPNSNIGKAITYLFRHWQELTQFLRIENAPLDNNPAERLLKNSIIHRKNSLFYRTENGALIGDILMSVIQTCVSAGKNPLRYLESLSKNRKKVFLNPDSWLPWTYEGNLV